MRGVRVIFLDIDGVLNCKKTPNPRDLPYIIDSRLLRIFLRIVARTWAKVVLISDWRHDPAGLFSARYWGIPYVDIVPYLPKRSRGEQILLWLRKHPRVTRYVVIDDRHCLNKEAISSFIRQRCQISVGLFHQSSPNAPADDGDESVTKSNTRRMNGSWNADSRNGASEMRIGGQPQDCVGDGLDSSVGHCRANELEISAMAPSRHLARAIRG